MRDASPLRLVVFDCGGTPADSFAAFGHEAPAQTEVAALVGLSLKTIVERLAGAVDTLGNFIDEWMRPCAVA